MHHFLSPNRLFTSSMYFPAQVVIKAAINPPITPVNPKPNNDPHIINIQLDRFL